MNGEKKQKIESLRYPLQKFIRQYKAGRIVLGINIVLTLLFAASFCTGACYVF